MYARVPSHAPGGIHHGGIPAARAYCTPVYAQSCTHYNIYYIRRFAFLPRAYSSLFFHFFSHIIFLVVFFFPAIIVSFYASRVSRPCVVLFKIECFSTPDTIEPRQLHRETLTHSRTRTRRSCKSTLYNNEDLLRSRFIGRRGVRDRGNAVVGRPKNLRRPVASAATTAGGGLSRTGRRPVPSPKLPVPVRVQLRPVRKICSVRPQVRRRTRVVFRLLPTVPTAAVVQLRTVPTAIVLPGRRLPSDRRGLVPDRVLVPTDRRRSLPDPVLGLPGPLLVLPVLGATLPRRRRIQLVLSGRFPTVQRPVRRQPVIASIQQPLRGHRPVGDAVLRPAVRLPTAAIAPVFLQLHQPPVRPVPTVPAVGATVPAVGATVPVPVVLQ